MSEEASISSAQAAARWLDAYRAVAVTLPMPTPTSANVAHARELIDAELAGMRLVISAMNEKRNELTLPSLLPPEVLALVFSFLATVAPIFIGPVGYYPKRTLGWVSVSHVCRRWRSTCLSQPSLWTHLTPDQAQPWEIFLERAKEASLFIEGSLRPHRDGTTHIQSMMDHRHHIQELTLSNIHSPELQELVNGLKGPLHRLRVLSLSHSSQRQTSFPSLPAGFLSDCAPNIQQLSLFGVIYPWGEGSPKITKFVYQHGITSYTGSQPEQPSHTHTYAAAVQTLRQMPALKTLNLVHALPDSAPEHDTEDVHLSFLRELTLKNDNDSCWRLWSQLRMPSGVYVNVQATRKTAMESLIISAFRSYLRTSSNPAFSSMSIQLPILASGDLGLILSEPRGSDEQRNDPHMSRHFSPPSISLHLCCSAATDMAKQLMATFSLEGIHDLTCTGGIGDSDMIRDIFLRARSVTDLSLGLHVAGPSLAAIMPGHGIASDSTQPDKSSASREPILMPDLRVLSCVAVNFTQRIQYAGASMFVHDILDKVLDSRNDLGLAPETLYIEGCDVLEDWVDGWRDIVEEVNWDLDEGDLAEPDEEENEDQYFGYNDYYDDWPY